MAQAIELRQDGGLTMAAGEESLRITRCLIAWKADGLISQSARMELQPEVAFRRMSISGGHKGSFVRGIGEDDDYWGESTKDGFPIVFLRNNGKSGQKPYGLIAYRCLNATVCMFVGVNQATSTDYEKLQESLAEFLDRSVSSLASRIGDGIASLPRTIQTDTPYHFIYFNPDSLSVRSSFPSTTSSVTLLQTSTAPTPPFTISKLVFEPYDHFAGQSVDDFAQIYVKAGDNWWLVLKRASGRTLTLFIPQWTSSAHHSTVVDAHERAENIIKANLENIFVS